MKSKTDADRRPCAVDIAERIHADQWQDEEAIDEVLIAIEENRFAEAMDEDHQSGI